MEEFQLQSLISSGENESLDFKQELHLKSARSKAEFIKDVISLANSSIEKGYLLVGVNDEKNIVGVGHIQEEQIQQVAHNYIDPPVIIRCSLVTIQSPAEKEVGVIEIKPTRKPHKVARTIEHINKDDVFVRRGSVITKASPEEIHRMYNANQGIELEIQHYVQKAEAHKKIGNWELAIHSYSRAINTLPTPELLVARGEVYENYGDAISKQYQISRDNRKGLPYNAAELRKKALIDYTDTLNLDPPLDIAIKARLGRLRQYSSVSNVYEWEDMVNDINWFRENAPGYTLGQAIAAWVDNWANLFSEDLEAGEDVVKTIDEAINLGYKEPDAYYLRSIGNSMAFNFGQALRDIEIAVSNTSQKDINRAKYLCHQAVLLSHLEKYNEAYESVLEARRIDTYTVKLYLMSFIPYDFTRKILLSYGLSNEFNEDVSIRYPPLGAIIQLILLWYSRMVSQYTTSVNGEVVEIVSELDRLANKYPRIIRSLKKIFDDKRWSDVRKGNPLSFAIHLPTYKEQLERKLDLSTSLDEE